jgi:UDP-N-acetylmuramyl pentapeptide phosphotransferase/UDP-N-acetylglucosamine-1-phosphate transferase
VTLAYSPNAAALLTFAVAAVLTAMIVPVVRRLGLRWGLTDTPDSRKQHTRPMVRLGGIGIVLGFSLALTLTWLLGGFADLEPSKDQLIWTTLAGCLCFFAIGLADDLFGVSMVAWSEGVRIGSIELPFGWADQAPALLQLPDWLSLLATLVWLVGITNAINWLDGLDGLAAGVSGIAAVGLLSVSFSLHQPAAGLLAVALAAVWAFCATTSTRPGSSWAMAVPTSWALPWPPSASSAPPRASPASACCCPC